MPVEQLLYTADEVIINGLQQSALQKRMAEEALFNKYAYFIKDGCGKYSIVAEDSFDAYSDTILYTINSITNNIFEGRSSLKTYIYKIFCNKCVDRIRKNTTNRESIHQTHRISYPLLKIADEARTIIQQLVEKTNTELLANKLKELGDKCRKILAMFADGNTDKEIAETMEYKTAQVIKTSRMRCLDKLRQAYNNTN